MKGKREKHLYGMLIALLLFALLLTALLFWDRGRSGTGDGSLSHPLRAGTENRPLSHPVDATTNVTLNMLLVGDRPEEHTWLDIPVETGSENTIRWLEENKGLTVVAMEELATIQSPIALSGSQN